MKAHDIDRHMRQLGTWVNWNETCDTFKSGAPQTEVQAIAVSWISSMTNLREAHARGCNLFVTHEPTFYSHLDNDPDYAKDACTQEKRSFLEETGMVVYRCHDVWDRVEGDGILDSWASFLGLDGAPSASETFWRVIPVAETTAGRFTRDLCRRVQALGQQAVPLVGDPDQRVSSVGIGTGAITSAREFHRLGADLAIVTELTWWRDARWALDSGIPLAVVDHTVSEEPGIVNLANYLTRQFPGIRVEYLPTHCPYQLIDAKS